MTSPIGLPALEPADPEPRQCGICGGWHLHKNPRVSCAANHLPGTCCHYGDQEVPAPERKPKAPRIADAVFAYDHDADALYYRLSGKQVAKTVSFGDRVMVDVDADGQAVGIEVLSPPGFSISQG